MFYQKNFVDVGKNINYNFGNLIDRKICWKRSEITDCFWKKTFQIFSSIIHKISISFLFLDRQLLRKKFSSNIFQKTFPKKSGKIFFRKSKSLNSGFSGPMPSNRAISFISFFIKSWLGWIYWIFCCCGKCGF